MAQYSFHSLCVRAVARFLGCRDACKAYVVFSLAVLNLAKSGFCKFIGNFLVPVSPISFSEFFLNLGNMVEPAFSLMMNVSILLTGSCDIF